MSLSEILALLERNLQPSSWICVDNESRDGGTVSFCIEDVHLAVSFSVTLRGSKPAAAYQIAYGSTLLGWFEFPLLSAGDPIPIVELHAALKAQTSAGTKAIHAGKQTRPK